MALPGISFGNLGNIELKPERSRELELGFDAALFRDRVSLEFSYYNKRTRDALIQRTVAGSSGTSEFQFFNLGVASAVAWFLFLIIFIVTRAQHALEERTVFY